MSTPVPNQSHLQIELAFNGEILSISGSREECSSNSRYWLPLANVKRLDTYMKLNNIPQINNIAHFAKLLAGHIVVDLRATSNAYKSVER